MTRDIRITDVRITPIAFRDGPLLNAAGIHEPWALRAIVELETSDGRVGISETYGDEPMLRVLAQANELVLGLSPFDLNRMEERVRATIRPAPGAIEFELAPGSHTAKNAAKVTSTFEVAMLDLQGQLLGAPIVDLLGGAVRDTVPYSAYLFFKYAEHIGRPYAADAWGEGIGPAQIVAQAQRMIDAYGFQSIKLKGGVFEPAHEIACMRALRAAFPGLPLRLDPNANWSLETSIRAAPELDELLEYYEDPTPGLKGMAELARHTRLPLATNMVITTLDDFRKGAETGAVKVLLSDHHYWGGLRVTQTLARMCALWDLGMSMHSNSHLGISLMAMTHVAASIPNLTYACDTHYPWQEEEVIRGGRVAFENGAVRLPGTPGLGVELDRGKLAELHAQYLACGVRNRDDLAQMRKYDAGFSGRTPRF
ncbi:MULTISPECIES: glucarate dehydratase family protein [unclassified Rhizobacter]|uniref:glucarate dehydratase family protein n=1 Tax=unclassified Rhizobacter TaxID=2640088 RepID=UPI0007012246|nr:MULTISPECIES: glucarate dehydratase family protein [unclassified Rhizobacter]KQU75525.1 glucarate dehydratase [Rhizobacter sp. Root29]KQW06900.1 glucarate dehydratase [Rhizobacter sp. Root1238]KRB18980.1 glucarate dehydratase [Rhizobacter sp. Root16D2]